MDLVIGFVGSVVIQFVGVIVIVAMFSGCAAEARGFRIRSVKPRVSHSKIGTPHVRVRR